MDLSRRRFLKGLMALAAVAAVGLPSVTPDLDAVIDEVERFLAADSKSTQPSGVFGSVRIDDAWYALHDGHISAAYRDSFQLVSDDCVVSTFSGLPYWGAVCVIDGNARLHLHADGRPHDLMFSLGRYSWACQARLNHMAAVLLPNGNLGLSLDFSGIGEMIHRKTYVT